MHDAIRWFKCKLKPPKNWLCESLMAAIHRKSCIKFIRKSLVVSVVLVVSVGKAIVNTCSEMLFQTPFLADFIFRNVNDKNLVSNRRKCGWNRREATGTVGDIGIMVKLNAFPSFQIYLALQV